MSEKGYGIYTGSEESSFVSADKLKKKNNKLDWITPLPEGKDFTYWSDRFKDRKEQYMETAEVPQHNFELNLPEESLVAFIGDQHVGSPEVDYDRIEAEMQAIVQTDNAYVVLMGDTVDGFFWNPAEFDEMEQVPEQYGYIKSMIEYLGENNKLILALGGDHDGWLKKSGANLLKEFTEKNHCFYSNGITYLTINVGEQQYKITAAHRLPGNSMYNKNHPQMRSMIFGEARGSDIVVSGHTHKKAIQQQSLQGYGDTSQMVTTMSLGAYKSNDEYARKNGWGKIATTGMYGSAVILGKEEKHIKPFYDVLEGVKDL